MKNFYVIVLLVGLAVAPGGTLRAADRIILIEGKTLTGTITDENNDEITIRLGPQMFLRVDKIKIQQIIRAPRPQPVRPAQGRAVKPPPIPIFIFPVVGETKTHEKPPVTVVETRVNKLMPVSGPEALDSFEPRVTKSCHWKGTPGSDEGGVHWKTVVITATTTASVPQWSPASQPPPERVKSWNDNIKDVESRNKAPVDLYAEAYVSLGARLTSLRAETEADLRKKSQQLYNQWSSRTEKMQQGLNRRRESRPVRALTNP